VVGGTHCTASAAADFYNQVGFREAWWRLSLGPLHLFTGRQIVTWGESLAFRIADVVNPQDLSWNFGFANLEQSRLPQYMIHPILELPEFGWLTQNFAEGIWEPPIQALDSDWIWEDTPDHRYSGAGTNGGSVDILAPFGGRFDLNAQSVAGGPTFFPNPNSQTIPGVPTSATWSAYPQASVATLGLPTNSIARWRMPTSAMTFSNEGIRFHALIDQLVEATVLYWHGHQLRASAGGRNAVWQCLLRHQPSGRVRGFSGPSRLPQRGVHLLAEHSGADTGVPHHHGYGHGLPAHTEPDRPANGPAA